MPSDDGLDVRDIELRMMAERGEGIASMGSGQLPPSNDLSWLVIDWVRSLYQFRFDSRRDQS